MGVFGGLLGIGGSLIMIPALAFYYGENQHLYQASAMICNFFVGMGAVLIHHQAKVLMWDVIKVMAPAAVVGVVLGVAASNSFLFAGEKSYVLARVFGVYLILAGVYKLWMYKKLGGREEGYALDRYRTGVWRKVVCGSVTGFFAGLLGLGGGSISVPLQHYLLKIPLKRAISNSAGTIAFIALVGAGYKNLSLAKHGVVLSESLKIAAMVIPGAIGGSMVGGWLMHKISSNIVRAAFIAVVVIGSYKMLTV